MTFLDYVTKNRKHGYINDYYNKNTGYNYRYQLHETILLKLNINQLPVNYLEFGVAEGNMIKFWASKNSNENSLFIGFDSFEGLPESWENKAKEHFNNEGKIPVISDGRVSFVKGWFQDTVHKYLKNMDFSNQSIFHLDADLFSSTLYVLFQIHPFIKKDDILIFDEFSSVENEFLALETFRKCIGKDWGFQFLGAVNNFRQVALQIK
ncbi:MAG: TylF/MycF/NovP-related O-methyltransferase [Bacteroidales bacterium]|jgi:hypothetical protein